MSRDPEALHQEARNARNEMLRFFVAAPLGLTALMAVVIGLITVLK